MGTNRTALVTGASSGIGEAFATLLAGRGWDVVVVARREQRLKELAGRLEQGGRSRVEVLAADLADPEGLERVAARVGTDGAGQETVDLLVNNAAYGSVAAFATAPVTDHLTVLQVNAAAVVRLTHAALLGMTARGSGGILNVSSVGGYLPAPRCATYAATKSFLTAFTESVHEEARGTGVHVTCLCPGATITEMTGSGAEGGGPQGWHVQTAEEVAAYGLAAVEADRAIAVPHVVNKASIQLAKVLPRALQRKVAGRVTRDWADPYAPTS